MTIVEPVPHPDALAGGDGSVYGARRSECGSGPVGQTHRVGQLRRQLELHHRGHRVQRGHPSGPIDRPPTASPARRTDRPGPSALDMPARTDAARYRLGQPPGSPIPPHGPAAELPGRQRSARIAPQPGLRLPAAGQPSLGAPAGRARTVPSHAGTDRRAASRTPGSVRPPGSAAYSDPNPRPRIR